MASALLDHVNVEGTPIQEGCAGSHFNSGSAFRHAWAEGTADDLLSQGHDEDYAAQLLRDLGGWKEESDTPFHYIQNAIKKRAYKFLEERNRQLYGPRQTD